MEEVRMGSPAGVERRTQSTFGRRELRVGWNVAERAASIKGRGPAMSVYAIFMPRATEALCAMAEPMRPIPGVC